MDLKVDVERVDDLRRRLTVEVPAAAVAAELDRAYAELSRSVAVPGFRRGRVPRGVLNRMFGDRVVSDVFDRLIRDSFVEAVEGQALPIVGRPEFETDAAGAGQPLRYHAVFEVRPEISAQGYLGIEVERQKTVVGDREVDSVLERMREANARLHPITDRTEVRTADVATLDYEARVGEKTIGKAEKREVEIGRNGFPPEFDANVAGAQVGSTVQFRVAYRDDHPVGELAGKQVDFEVHLRGLSCKELPALDDDFAKSLGDSDTLADLRRRIQEGLESEAARHADDVVRRQLLAKLVELNEIPVPNAMIARQLDALVDEAWEDWGRQRIQPRNESAAKERLRSELEGRAREQVKLSMLLDAVARQEGLTVTDTDIDERVAQIAEQAGAAAERVHAFYREPGAREQLRASMLQSRAIDAMLRAAQVRVIEAPSQIADVPENG